MQTYKTSLGTEITISPIPPMLVAKVEQAARKKAQELYPATRPMYEVTDAGGGTQLLEHDAASVSTPEERAAWDAYQTALTNRAGYVNEKLLNFMLSRGLAIELPADDTWAKNQEFWGVEVPTDPQARIQHYIQTEVLGSAQDIEDLTVAIMGATGVKTEVLEAARASFRGDLRQGSGSPGSTGGPIPVGQARPALDDVGAVPRVADGQNLGIDAGAMG